MDAGNFINRLWRKNEISSQPLTDGQESEQPVQIYMMGVSNQILLLKTEKRVDYSTPVSLGLETTMALPYCEQGNAILQALQDYVKETGREVAVQFFSGSVTMVDQLKNDFKNGNVPDLVIDSKTHCQTL